MFLFVFLFVRVMPKVVINKKIEQKINIFTDKVNFRNEEYDTFI